MGFDFYMTINVRVDSATGMPFVWGKNSTKLPYDPEAWCLPEEFREFAQLRGHFLRHYTDPIEKMFGNTYEVYVETLLFEFPKWSEISDRIGFFYDEWDEAKHNHFRKCLEWCADKGGYRAEWSY